MSKYIKLKEEINRGLTINNFTCYNCGRVMQYYKSQYGGFIGCPNYGRDIECKDTFSVYGSPKDYKLFGIGL